MNKPLIALGFLLALAAGYVLVSLTWLSPSSPYGLQSLELMLAVGLMLGALANLTIWKAAARR